MHHLFTAHHVQLLNACYPPTSALLTAGPSYSPSSHELSRLTYYASNHPGKLTKFGDEVEKRIKSESKKAKAGNIRARASLLISLAILRSLATECRSDIALLAPSLIASLNAALTSVPQDLEVVARLASVFTTWTTYTSGQLVGTDRSFTEEYLSVLQQFARLAGSDHADMEVRNRTRLIGFGAVTGALNSEALYSDSRQFRTQTTILLQPILVTLFQADIAKLTEQASTVKDNSGPAYLAEFRTRPALERRAASIHLHIDGETGPSFSEVSDAALRAMFSLLSHAGGTQLENIMQSSFDNFDVLKGWADQKHCCWFAQQLADWAPYQYRYVIPTWIVAKLMQSQEAQTMTAQHTSLAAMVTTVFSSAIPMINLSSSDLMSKLLALLVRRASNSPVDPLLASARDCIASLGCHVYYSDQIQDLAAEIINRLVMIEVQTNLDDTDPASWESRSASIRYLLQALDGLIRTANEHEEDNDVKPPLQRALSNRVSSLSHAPKISSAGLAARRTRVSPELWQDTLTLLCDRDERIRDEYCQALVYYLSKELQKHGEFTENKGMMRLTRGDDGGMRQTGYFDHLLNSGDSANRLLNAINAYLYILLTNPALAFDAEPGSSSYPASLNGEPTTVPASPVAAANGDPSPLEPSSPLRRSLSKGPKAKKASLMRRLTMIQDEAPISFARNRDYENTSSILVAMQECLPIRGLHAAVPMLLQLEGELDGKSGERDAVVCIKNIFLKVWLAIGKNWECRELVDRCNVSPITEPEQTGIGCKEALEILVASQSVQDVFGLPADSLRQRLSRPWDPKRALHNNVDGPHYDTGLRSDNVSPLLKISPALMKNDNISMQSLCRGTRGLGVTDLREALEGRAAMSNPNLIGGRPSSIVSTLDRASTMTGGDFLTPLSLTPSRKAKRANQGDVKDVLSRLGIGKNVGQQNGTAAATAGNLLKASFPTIARKHSEGR